MKTNQEGFTLIELIIVIGIICTIVAEISIVIIGITGNFYYTEKSVLKKIRLHNPLAEEVVDDKRNIIDHSVIYVSADGRIEEYCLNSNLLFNYEVLECPRQNSSSDKWRLSLKTN